MTEQEAYDTLVDNIHAPIFFAKLASDYGIKPATAEQAEGMLKLAGKLRNANEFNTMKAASSHSNIVSDANDHLDKLLASYGYDAPNEFDSQVKEAAVDALKQPQIKEAAEVFGQYLAKLS